MKEILMIITLLLVTVTFLPVWRNPHWTVRSMDFPRLQLAVLAMALLCFQWIFLDVKSVLFGLVIGATAICLIWQLWWIVPYTRFWPKEVAWATQCASDRRLCIVTANVLTPNRNAEKLIRLVKQFDTDILVTLETDQWWQDHLDVLETDMPYTMKCPLDNLYGMHVYSRLPLEQAEIKFLVESDVPSMHTLVRLPCKDTVRMHFLHPAPPSPTENEESAERDAELVIVARSLENSTQPIIVTGDLNDVAWSATTRLFRKISGLLDPRVGRGMFNTFHTRYPVFRWPLDHIFHSRHFTVCAIKRLPSFGSDHFALVTELCFSPGKNDNEDGLEPDSFDRDLAHDIAETKNKHPKQVPAPSENES
jgi:endonuclease/exonuclease/phosphatase (EEP) superfamily protein YafD